jgi:putative addiction module antidote
MVALKVRKVGNSLGFTLPLEAASRLKVEEGDTIHLTEAPGGYRITAYDPEFVRQMEIARRVMREDRDILKALADA